MKASEIRQLTADELNTKLNDLKAELFNLRFQLAINQLENPMRISAVKKDIARVKTCLLYTSPYGPLQEGRRRPEEDPEGVQNERLRGLQCRRPHQGGRL